MNLALVPTLPGAVEAVKAGIVSTLQGQNERDNENTVEGMAQRHRSRTNGTASNNGEEDARFRLLFDPQVSHRTGGWGGQEVRLAWGSAVLMRLFTFVVAHACSNLTEHFCAISRKPPKKRNMEIPGFTHA